MASKKTILIAWFVLGLMAFLIGACGGGDDASTAVPTATQPSPTNTPTIPPTALPTATLAPTATTAATATPAPTPAPVELSPSQAFSRVSPSIAFVSTPTTFGSAILIDDGYLLTNSHVVYGFREVRIVFSDGSEFVDVPVFASDDLLDMAILGPINTNLDPLGLNGRENLDIGSEVYLVGYPAEIEEFPQPTITRGILSRVREWEAAGITYLQTDAAITGGQSGGALVSSMGEIIGLSGLRFTDVGFGLVASASDLSPLVDALVAGRDASVLGSRPLPIKGGTLEHQIEIANPWDVRHFVVDAPFGSTVELELSGAEDGFLAAIDPFGLNVFYADTELDANESGSIIIDSEGPYIVAVGLSLGSNGSFTLGSNFGLVDDNDTDDGEVLFVGDTFPGNVDTYSGVDYFFLDPEQGQTVEVKAESINIDVELRIDFPGSRFDQVAYDDDSGGGLLGTDAAITYRAIQSGTHYLVVTDISGAGTGGYFISVAEALPDATPLEIPPSYATVDSSFGVMSLLVSASAGYSVFAPFDWISVEQPDSDFSVAGPNGNVLIASSEKVDESDDPSNTLSDFTDDVVALFPALLNGAELLTRESVETAQGFEAVRLEWSVYDGLLRQVHYMILNEPTRTTSIVLQAVGEEYDELIGMFDYILESITFE